MSPVDGASDDQETSSEQQEVVSSGNNDSDTAASQGKQQSSSQVHQYDPQEVAGIKAELENYKTRQASYESNPVFQQLFGNKPKTEQDEQPPTAVQKVNELYENKENFVTKDDYEKRANEIYETRRLQENNQQTVFSTLNDVTGNDENQAKDIYMLMATVHKPTITALYEQFGGDMKSTTEAYVDLIKSGRLANTNFNFINGQQELNLKYAYENIINGFNKPSYEKYQDIGAFSQKGSAMSEEERLLAQLNIVNQ